MNLAKVSKILAASFFLLTLLGDTTEACKCYFSHPQRAFCIYDIVLKAKFVDYFEMDSDIEGKYYEIETSKILKGPKDLPNVLYAHTERARVSCGYDYRGSFEEEYIITANYLYDNIISIAACDFIRPWDSLTLAQRRGFTSEYSKGCSCSIVECHSKCSITSNQCVRADSTMPPNFRDFQNKHMACLPQVEKNGTCTWKSLDTQGS